MILNLKIKESNVEIFSHFKNRKIKGKLVDDFEKKKSVKDDLKIFNRRKYISSPASYWFCIKIQKSLYLDYYKFKWRERKKVIVGAREDKKG